LEQIVGHNFSHLEFEKAITCPSDRFVFIENHRPAQEKGLNHFHPTIEINYLHDCDMVYSFSGNEAKLKQGHLCVFWAAYPHRAVSTTSDGWMTNAYVSLSEFLRWQIPSNLSNYLLSGAVLVTKDVFESDRIMAERWSREIDQFSDNWQRLHVMEIQCRLNRLAIEGWDVLVAPDKVPPTKMLGGKAVLQFEKMMRFITENFSEKISVADVAEAGGISANYAMTLFNKILGHTIKDYITDIRIHHSKMALTETNDKILTIAMDCGFGSLSTFYDTFQRKLGVSPAAFRKSRNVIIVGESVA